MNDESVVIAHSRLEYGYRDGSKRLYEGEIAYADKDGILFDYAQESGYLGGNLFVPWENALKHAPTEELWKALNARSEIHHKHGADNVE